MMNDKFRGAKIIKIEVFKTPYNTVVPEIILYLPPLFIILTALALLFVQS
jgi:hypothetical protein